MNKWIFSLICGIVAGVIDIVPMVIQQLDMYSIVSAFVHWIVVAFVVNYVQLSLRGWLKGMLVAEVLAVPVIILVMKTEIDAVIPMIIMSAVIGSLLGMVGEEYGSSGR